MFPVPSPMPSDLPQHGMDAPSVDAMYQSSRPFNLTYPHLVREKHSV